MNVAIYNVNIMKILSVSIMNKKNDSVWKNIVEFYNEDEWWMLPRAKTEKRRGRVVMANKN